MVSRIHFRWRRRKTSATLPWIRALILGLLLGAVLLPITIRSDSRKEVATSTLQVLDLEGRAINPLDGAQAKALVFLFVSVECPISNSYAPEMQRLDTEFAPQGVTFKLVYPNPDERAEAIQKHVKEYGLHLGVLRDPQHRLVKAAAVRLTPEVAVFVPRQGFVYHGRIDNQYVDFGKARPAATEHDLREVLTAILQGKPIPYTATRAIGCYISEVP